MGKLTAPFPVKLIIGFLFQEEKFLRKAQEILSRHFGKTDYESSIIFFTYTDYYQKELGNNLKRKFISFQELIPPEKLSGIKNLTNKLEIAVSGGNSRKINIDPGYLTMAKLILASTKDYSHRIYLNKGIFAEITLNYRKNTFQPMEWTYPDYRTEEYIKIFLEIRKLYAQEI